MIVSKILILNLHAFQQLGEKGWFQIDRMMGLNRPIGNRLKRHGSARIVKEDFAGRATGGADKTEQGQEKRITVRHFPCRMLWCRSHR